MTEQEFDTQVWRRFDVVTTDTGIETTVMNVCFTTRSVRIYVKNAPPEWLPCKRIEKHTTRKGDTAVDGIYIARTFITYDMCSGLQQKEFEAKRGKILTDEEMYKQAKMYYKYEGIIQS